MGPVRLVRFWVLLVATAIWPMQQEAAVNWATNSANEFASDAKAGGLAHVTSFETNLSFFHVFVLKQTIM